MPVILCRVPTARKRVEVGYVGLLRDDGQVSKVVRHRSGPALHDHTRLPEISQGADGVGTDKA